MLVGGLDKRRLPWQSPIQAKGLEKYVYSARELIDAIGYFTKLNVDSLPVGDTLPVRGLKIVVAAPLTIKSPIIIPAQCIGLEICSTGHCPVYPSGVVSDLFKVGAALVSIHDLLIISLSTTQVFSNFVKVNASLADYLRVLNNHVVADQVFTSDATNDSAGAIVQGNYQQVINNTHSASIVMNGSNCKIMGNVLHDGGGDGITMATGRDCVIMGNDLGGSDITSSGSTGYNTIGLNTQVGTITRHARDAVGLNT